MFFCPFCQKEFQNEAEKYQHLVNHKSEVSELARNNLIPFPKISAMLGYDSNSFFNSQRRSHQYLSVILNANDNQYKDLLTRLNANLNLYSDKLECQAPNMIKLLGRSDFFILCSTLDVLNCLSITFEKFPIIPWKTKTSDVDFVFSEEDIAIELKTPIGTTQNLTDYVLSKDANKQLASRTESIKLLVIDTKYSFPDFPVSQEGLKIGLEGKDLKKTFWNCLVSFNNFNKKYDSYFKKGVSFTDVQKEKIDSLARRLSDTC